jgi:uncharacterized membrane protein YhfC
MVSLSGMIGLNVAALICLCLPVLAYFICRGRIVMRARNIVVGACCFVFFALVLEGALNYYLLVSNHATAPWLHAHQIAFGVYGACVAGLFEETGRLFGFTVLARKENRAGVAYGIGHGGAEAWLIGLVGFAQQIIFAALLNQGKLASVMGARLPPGALVQLVSSLQHLTFVGALPGALERASALVFQIALSLLVWRCVRDKRPSLYIAAILAHAALDMPAAMSVAGVVHLSTWTLEAIYATIAVVILIVLLRRLPPRGSARRDDTPRPGLT